MRLTCVIFDVDGTLTQTNELIFASFNHVARRYLGKTFTRQQIIALFGPPEEGGLSKVLEERDVATAMDDLCRFYRENHEAMARSHPGVIETLQFLRRKGVKTAVFTGKGARTTGITLNALQLAPYFDVVVSGSDVVNHKPHPEGILKVLATLSVPAAEVLMVGDALSDVAASRSANVRVAAALWDSYDRERMLQANADYVFHSTGDMLDWFRQHVN